MYKYVCIKLFCLLPNGYFQYIAFFIRCLIWRNDYIYTSFLARSVLTLRIILSVLYYTACLSWQHQIPLTSIWVYRRDVCVTERLVQWLFLPCSTLISRSTSLPTETQVLILFHSHHGQARIQKCFKLQPSSLPHPLEAPKTRTIYV